MTEQEKELITLKQNRLKYFLGMFYVKPNVSPGFKQAFDKFKTYYDSTTSPWVKCSSQQELLQLGQAVLLSYGRQVDYISINSFTLVNDFLLNEPVNDKYGDYELVIIYHGFKEMPNRQLHNIVNQLVSYREVRGLKTLVISTKEDSEFGQKFYRFTSFSSVEDDL